MGHLGFSPSTHCWDCFGCLVRRGAFIAAGLRDNTPYAERELDGDRRRRAQFLTDTRREDYEALRSAERRGVEPADVLALGLPERLDLDRALDLARAGLSEMAAVRIA